MHDLSKQFIENVINGKDLIIFGTGARASNIFKEYQISPIFYVDNDSKKWGQSFLNKPIYSSKELLRYNGGVKNGNMFILIASIFKNEISQQLSEMGFKEKKDYIAFNELNLNSETSQHAIGKGDVSFSQSGEDKICLYIISTMGLELTQCSYLDLGANHAREGSNTYLFYSLGCSGVLVEANSTLIPELKYLRSRDIVLNNCVSTVSGDIVDFYVLNTDGLSTTDLAHIHDFINENENVEITDTIKLKTLAVNDIIECYFHKTPTILSIDIEGKDMEVLESIDFEKYRPLIIIVEMIDYKNSLSVGLKNRDILIFMELKQYVEYAFTGINSIFIDIKQIDTI